MTKTLTGVQFVRNGQEFDYCFQESIQSLLDCCDKVIVVDAGSDDGTTEILEEMALNHEKMFLLVLSKAEWDAQEGSQKLAYFTNKAIELVETDYIFSLQSDEVLDPSGFPFIRQAMEMDKIGFMCRRINLWGSPYTQLDVHHDRMPCSDYVIRLAKNHCLAVGDAESLDSHPCATMLADKIKIWHMGFVRKRNVMKSKIINMQCKVFGMEHYDSKLDEADQFNPKLWFDGEDLKPIEGELPKYIEAWAAERAKDYQ